MRRRISIIVARIFDFANHIDASRGTNTAAALTGKRWRKWGGAKAGLGATIRSVEELFEKRFWEGCL